MEGSKNNETFGDFCRFVPEMKKRGFGHTLAFQLVKAGLIETFKVGRATFVRLDELNQLPTRLKSKEAQQRLDVARYGRAA